MAEVIKFLSVILDLKLIEWYGWWSIPLLILSNVLFFMLYVALGGLNDSSE